MKKISMIAIAIVALSCGDSKSSSSEATSTDDEMMEKSSGEDISPQLVPDDSLEKSRFDVDTISSSKEAQQQSERDSVN